MFTLNYFCDNKRLFILKQSVKVYEPIHQRKARAKPVKYDDDDEFLDDDDEYDPAYYSDSISDANEEDDCFVEDDGFDANAHLPNLETSIQKIRGLSVADDNNKLIDLTADENNNQLDFTSSPILLFQPRPRKQFTFKTSTQSNSLNSQAAPITNSHSTQQAAPITNSHSTQQALFFFL